MNWVEAMQMARQDGKDYAMALAHRDIDKLVDAIMTYVNAGDHRALLGRLKSIRGNQSYRDTVARIEAHMRAEAQAFRKTTKRLKRHDPA